MRQKKQESDAEPIRESAAEQPERAKALHPSDPRRFADGTQRPGVPGLRLKHGGFARLDTLPPDIRERLGDLDSFRAGIESDQGGRSNMTTIKQGYGGKLTTLEGLYRLLSADVLVNGPLTPRGRVRSTFHALMVVIDRWDKCAQRLGLERKQRDISELSADEYVLSQTPDDSEEDTSS